MADDENNLAFRTAFGSRLRSLRKKRGFTQAGLAEKIGYKSSVAVSKIENGHTIPNLVTLAKIADLLSIDLHWLITGTASRAVKRLKPFALAHLTLRQQDVVNLRNEVADLGIRESMGEPHALRAERIAGEIQDLRLYCKVIRETLNEVLDDLGESI